MMQSTNCQQAKPGSQRSIRPDGKIGTRSPKRRLFSSFVLMAACIVAVQARPLMASATSTSKSVTAEAKSKPTKTELSSSAPSGARIILTAKVSPSVATGFVLFTEGPPNDFILLGQVHLVRGIAKLRLPQGIRKGYQQFDAIYLGSTSWETSSSNTIHVTFY
jgi:hypothetical protein